MHRAGATQPRSRRSRTLAAVIVVSWLLTIPTVVIVALILVLCDPIARVTRLFGIGPLERLTGRMQRLVLRVFRVFNRTRVTVERSPAIEPGLAYIVVSNHQSFFDIPLLGSYLPGQYPKLVAKRELARWIPTVSFTLRRGGHAIIDRNDPLGARDVIMRMGRECQRRNASAGIFPEGTRSRDGTLRRFRPAGTLALLKAAPDMAVLPTIIDPGSGRLLRHNFLPIPHGVRVRVRFADPIPRRPGEVDAALLERAREVIAATLAQWQGEEASGNVSGAGR